jgi:hypothetical protein
MIAALSGSPDSSVSSGGPVLFCPESSRADQYCSPADFRSTISVDNVRPQKLPGRFKEALRSRHYSPRTEDTCCQWVTQYIFFHHVRHPAEMAEPEINLRGMHGKI